MKNKKTFLKFLLCQLPIVFSIVFIMYYIYCTLLTRFSFSMLCPFALSVILLIGLYIVINKPIDKTKRKPSFLYIFIIVSNIMYFSLFLIVILFNFFVKKPIANENIPYQYIIVFGAGVSVDESKNVIINKRIEKAIEYAKIDDKTIFIMSGAKQDDEIIEEANYMKNYMVDKGIDKNRILVDLFSYNTYENISNSLFIIKEDLLKRNQFENVISRPFTNSKSAYDFDYLNIGFVSNEFHLWRISMMAKKLGIDNPNCIEVKTTPSLLVFYEIREVMALFKAFVLGQLSV